MKSHVLVVGVALAAGCTKSTTTQAIGAVCARAQKISRVAHAERVAVVTAIKERVSAEDVKAEERAAVAARCEATVHLDTAVQEVYRIILDAQLVTTNRWEPLSEAVARIGSAGTERCDLVTLGEPDAFSKVRAWAAELQTAHEGAYRACRQLTK